MNRQAGRGLDQQKKVKVRPLFFPVIYAGTGKRTEFGVGGLLVGVYDDGKDEFQTVSRVGTGLTDDE